MENFRSLKKERGIRGARGCCAAILIALFLSFFSKVLFAQTPGEDVGAQAERFRQDMKQRQQEVEEKPVKPVPMEIEEPAGEAPLEGPSFTLKGIQVTGSTIFQPEDFLPIYVAWIGQEVSFSGLKEIADRIKGKYKAQGYLTTTVIVPEQDIKDGQVEIRVIEGKMGDLSVEGNKWFSTGLIEKFFHSKKNELLNVKTLQRDLLRLNLNPDFDVQSVLSAGQDPETTDITIKVKENFPFHAGFGVDNQGSRLVGKYRPSFSLRSSNLSGRMDSIYVSYLFSSSSSGESLSYSLPIGTYGTKFGLDVTYFETKLGKEYTASDITGVTQIYTPNVSWELALTDTFQAYGEVGMDIKSIKKKTGRAVTSSDQLRMPYANLDVTKSDAFGMGGQTYWHPQVSLSTSNFLGASSRNHPTASRSNTGGFFAKYEQDLTRIQRMPFGTYILFKTFIQFSSHTLPSSEQLQLGGSNSVRGYPEGDYLADMGGYLNFEWYIPAFFIPERWKIPGQDSPLRHQIEPFFFADLGKGKLKEVQAGESKDKFLASVGGGVKVRLKKNFFLRLAWAVPVGNRPGPNSGPSTFHISFQTDI